MQAYTPTVLPYKILLLETYPMTKKALTDILPIKFRHGAGVGKSEKNKEGKTVYDKYLIVPYIDARDVMDHLDEVE